MLTLTMIFIWNIRSQYVIIILILTQIIVFNNFYYRKCSVDDNATLKHALGNVKEISRKLITFKLIISISWFIIIIPPYPIMLLSWDGVSDLMFL